MASKKTPGHEIEFDDNTSQRNKTEKGEEEDKELALLKSIFN